MQLNSGSYPLVSVAICTYNGAAYLTEQLETILNQTYTNLEVIVADDGSTDSTVKIIKEFQQKDNRIKFFQNEKNLGYNKNFEKAFLLCQGDFIAIADHDDIWDTGKIDFMMKAWPEGSLFIYSLSGTFTNNDFVGRKWEPDIVYTDVDDVFKLVFNSPVHGHACMFKKELLALCTPFPDDIFYDWWLSMHAAATGIIGCVPHTLTWHREHGNNYSRNLTSIKEKEQRNDQLRLQCANFIETFCNRNILKQPDKEQLLVYAALLKTMDDKKFSLPMFRYVIKNRKRIFHYKKQKPFIIFSYVKNAVRMAYKGLL